MYPPLFFAVSDPDSLELRLVEVPLDTTDFEALSYVWSDQSQKVPIRCNGQDHSIGQNLHEALMEYQRQGSTRGLWVDAICINQSCDTEKSQQVRMMRDIYGIAKRTIIWLGPLQPNDIEGIDLAEMIYAKCRKNNEYNENDGFIDRDFNCKDQGVPEPIEGQDIRRSWRALFNILIHPWFTRIWIVQELLVSQHPIMWRGERSIEPDTVLWMAHQIGGKADLRRFYWMVFGEPSFPASNIALCHYRYRESNPHPLWIFMFSTIGMEATDKRDRYFALAGISTGFSSCFVDYSRPLEQVACQVGLMLLLGSQEFPMLDGLDHLADLPNRSLLSQQRRIPSWIPDLLSEPLKYSVLSVPYSTLRLRTQMNSFPFPEFRLIAENLEIIPKFPYSYPAVQEMRIKSLLLDKVKAVILPVIPVERSEGMDISSETLECLHAREYWLSVKMIQFIREALQLVDPKLAHQDEIISSDSFEHFWRTLIYNRVEDPREEHEPQHWVGISFGYWYMTSKLYLTRRWEENPDLFLLHLKILNQLMKPFAIEFASKYGGRSFFVSESGRMGWAPISTSPGDTVAIFKGNRIPFIAKSVGNNLWEYAGGCYVHGLMDGEPHNGEDLEWKFLRFV
ncbi:HET-domain-containing protein [Pyrenochaeta sp. DS3sAY3a]|nr:HET-domain-containing protein [Pyrenochaeta sp. DS3sAY3a]